MKRNLFFQKEKGGAVCTYFLKLTSILCLLGFASVNGWAQTTVILDDPHGKWDGIEDTEVQVYPNPATDLVHVVPPVNESISYFEILDLTGQVLVAIAVTGAMSLEVYLGAGTYVFQITTAEEVYHRSVVLN